MRIVAHGNRLASMGQPVVVEVPDGGDTVHLRAPFYRRTIPLRDVASVGVAADDGLNHGAVNWFVVGRARSARGVRLSTGGRARVDIVTTDGRRYGVVVDSMSQAHRLADAIREGAPAPDIT